MATVVERSQALAALAPLVQAAATGTALGGGGRQHVAAAVAAVIRTCAAVLFGTQEPDSDICAEVAAREALARPFLAEQVAAGRAGAQPRPCGGAKAYRDWAHHAEFGVGAAQMPDTAREARQRGRGQRRRDKAAAAASSPPSSPGAAGKQGDAVSEEPLESIPQFPTLQPVRSATAGAGEDSAAVQGRDATHGGCAADGRVADASPHAPSLLEPPTGGWPTPPADRGGPPLDVETVEPAAPSVLASSTDTGAVLLESQGQAPLDDAPACPLRAHSEATDVKKGVLETGGKIEVWRFMPPEHRDAGIRTEPSADAPCTGHALRPGECFAVASQTIGPNKVRFLELADGRGWMFESVEGVGKLCHRCEEGVGMTKLTALGVNHCDETEADGDAFLDVEEGSHGDGDAEVAAPGRRWADIEVVSSDFPTPLGAAVVDVEGSIPVSDGTEQAAGSDLGGWAQVPSVKDAKQAKRMRKHAEKLEAEIKLLKSRNDGDGIYEITIEKFQKELDALRKQLSC